MMIILSVIILAKLYSKTINILCIVSDIVQYNYVSFGLCCKFNCLQE